MPEYILSGTSFVTGKGTLCSASVVVHENTLFSCVTRYMGKPNGTKKCTKKLSFWASDEEALRARIVAAHADKHLSDYIRDFIDAEYAKLNIK